MSRKIIELVQVLVDRIHQGGYTQRALEDDIYAESQKRVAAEKDRDHWKQARQEAIEAGELMRAEIETLRQELADAKRDASDEFTERQVLTVEQQQDAAIWQQQLDAARAEIETLKGAMAADDKRLRDAEERIWPGVTWGCDAPDKMADEILHLRQQLADAQRAVSDAFAEVNSLREKLTAAEAAVTLQRTGIELQRRVVDKVRQMLFKPNSDISYGDINGLRAALAELDAEPAPVAEPLDAEGGA